MQDLVTIWLLVTTIWMVVTIPYMKYEYQWIEMILEHLKSNPWTNEDKIKELSKQKHLKMSKTAVEQVCRKLVRLNKIEMKVDKNNYQRLYKLI